MILMFLDSTRLVYKHEVVVELPNIGMKLDQVLYKIPLVINALHVFSIFLHMFIYINVRVIMIKRNPQNLCWFA